MDSTVELEGYEFAYKNMKCFCDHEKKRIAFVSIGYDEIHLIVELIDGRLLFHPRWNVRIETSETDSKHYIIDVNFVDKLVDLED